MADVAILGTGRMGSAMARRVALAGHRVTVWNRTEAAARAVVALAPDQMSVASGPRDAVRGRDVVLVVLADGVATRTVVLDRGVLAALTPGAVVCDLGTSGMAAALDLAAGINDTRARFVDAPVSGSVSAVDSGTLLVMAGGEPDAVRAASTVLTAFARKVLHIGPVGTGQAVKLAVNLVVHNLNAAIAEALTLAVDAGIPAVTAYDVFQESVVAAPFVVYKRAAFLDADPPVAMSLDLVGKDLRLITSLATEFGASIPVTEAVMESVTAACRAGFGPSDMATLSQFLRMHAEQTPAA